MLLLWSNHNSFRSAKSVAGYVHPEPQLQRSAKSVAGYVHPEPQLQRSAKSVEPNNEG